MMDQLMKSYMAIMAERDAAIRERNMALVEKKKALADRDTAMSQRDAAVSERNSVMLERNDVITQLQYHSRSISGNNLAHGPSGNGISHGEKHMLQQQQHMDLLPHLAEAAYKPREVPFSDTFPNSSVDSATAKSIKAKRPKQKKAAPSKKPAKLPGKGKRGSKGLSKQVTIAAAIGWNDEQDLEGGPERKDNMRLNQVSFDEAVVPGPVCSCTGKLQPCYKWGNGGWQSACCTNTISMFPLPHLGNKRHSRMGGRKMSGSVYTKLLSRLVAEGHDPSSPIDLKNHWARHGTNRYITIK